MTMPNFNTNFSNSNRQSHLVLHEESLNGQFHTLNSNNTTFGGFNNINIQENNVYLSSQFNAHHFGQTNPLISHLTTTTRTTTTTQSTRFATQLSIGQRVTNEVRNTCTVLPQLVQNNANPNVNYLPTSLDFQGNQVCVTEVVQTKFLDFQNQVNETRLLRDSRYNYNQRNQYNPRAQNHTLYQNPPRPTENIHQQNPNISDENGDEYDGRTHSLPYKKYGPYTCPTCNGVFATSQMFAAHIGAHYKHESAEQKRTRLLARHRKKNKTDRLVQLNGSRNNNIVIADEAREKTNEREICDVDGFLLDVPVKDELLEV